MCDKLCKMCQEMMITRPNILSLRNSTLRLQNFRSPTGTL